MIGNPVSAELFDCENGLTKKMAAVAVISGQMKTNIVLPAKSDVILIVGGK